jgi:hypothetical protein
VNPRAERWVIRARRRSKCRLCLNWITPGQQITRLPDQAWVHLHCITEVKAVRGGDTRHRRQESGAVELWTCAMAAC